MAAKLGSENNLLECFVDALNVKALQWSPPHQEPARLVLMQLEAAHSNCRWTSHNIAGIRLLSCIQVLISCFLVWYPMYSTGYLIQSER